MKRFVAALAIAVLLAAVPAVLGAARVSNKTAGVALWLPDDWEIDSDEEDGLISADAPDGDAFCVLQVLVKEDDMEAALESYEDVLADEIDDFSSTAEDSEGEVDGMETISITGEGRRDDADWSVSATLVATGRSVLLLAIGWEKGKEGAFAPLRGKIVDSLRQLLKAAAGDAHG